MFDKLCDIVMIVRKYSINWIVLIQNCCRSHYKFICWYFFVSVHSQMMFLLFTQLELMIYVLIEVITSNYEYKNDVHGKNNSPIERNIKSYECMAWVVHQWITMYYWLSIYWCTYFKDIYVSYKRDNVMKQIVSIYNQYHLQVSQVYWIMLGKLFSNCIALLHKGCKSYRPNYLLILILLCMYWLIMVLQSIHQFRLMIFDTIKVIKSNFKDIINTCGQKAHRINTNIKS